ncbi:DUF1692-domain-containing protein [Lactarius indigo]|nr:DUF1692-domain-containing protein [Lactarius indigo]
MLTVFSDLTVDLRDVVDRLYLSKGFHQDGTLFDIGQVNTLKEHAEALTARQAIAESRKSRDFLADLFHRSLQSSNLHITTLGHGYSNPFMLITVVCTLLLFVELIFIDLTVMNLSHVITEFSFGKHFPEITHPLDNSFEITHDEFVAYQYYLRVVPTTYLSRHSGVPGIFFKSDIEPVRLTLIQRTTTLAQFFIRCVGVIGGIFVCASWGIRATDRMILAVAGPDDTGNIAPTPDSSRSALRSKWTGGALRARPSNAEQRIVASRRLGGGWIIPQFDYSGVSSYANSPAGSPMLPYSPYSPATVPPLSGRTASGGYPGTPSGLGLSPGVFRPVSPGGGIGGGLRTPATAATLGSPAPGLGTPGLGTPGFGHFPPTPRSPLSGFAALPPPRDTGKKDD